MIKIYSPIQKYTNWWPSSHRLRNQPNWCYLGTSLEYISPRVLPFLLDQLEPKRGLRPLLVKLRHQRYLARVWLGSTLAVHLGVPVLPAVAKVWGDGLSLQQQHTNKQNAPKTKQKNPSLFTVEKQRKSWVLNLWYFQGLLIKQGKAGQEANTETNADYLTQEHRQEPVRRPTRADTWRSVKEEIGSSEDWKWTCNGTTFPPLYSWPSSPKRENLVWFFFFP